MPNQAARTARLLTGGLVSQPLGCLGSVGRHAIEHVGVDVAVSHPYIDTCGVLFVVYGVIVTLIGVLDGPSELEKAQGVRINLWMGLGMLALGLLMLLWLRLNPPEEKAVDPEA